MKEAAAVKEEEEEEVLGGLPCLGCGEKRKYVKHD